MAKYALLNCWSDQNKGDLGIMIATIEELQKQDPEAEIIGISCFDAYDPMFQESHVILQKSLSKIYPAIFGVLGLHIGRHYKKALPYKLFAGFLEDIRYVLLSIFPKNSAIHFLKKDEQRTLKAILSCDVVFSKGGSVFTDYNSRRGQTALKRQCRLYALLHKFGCKYYILGQSFGPVQRGVSTKRVNNVIANARHVFIRETICVREYPMLYLSAPNVSFSNDAAFLLQPKDVVLNPIDSSCINVGITVREISRDVSGYVTMMQTFITRLIRDEHACVHIFRQVSMENEPDNQMAERIIESFQEEYSDRLIYHKEEYLPQELCWLYGQMDAFIGTRLHSTIFAMRAGTPPIGLIYQGTKTQGIFENIGIPELVIHAPINAEILWEKYLYLKTHREQLQDQIAKGVKSAQNTMRAAILMMVQDARGELHES